MVATYSAGDVFGLMVDKPMTEREDSLSQLIPHDSCCSLMLSDIAPVEYPAVCDCEHEKAVESVRKFVASIVKAAYEAAANECERHAEFCHSEAHKGGDFQYLNTRRSEASYNAQRIRALPPESALLGAQIAELEARQKEATHWMENVAWYEESSEHCKDRLRELDSQIAALKHKKSLDIDSKL